MNTSEQLDAAYHQSGGAAYQEAALERFFFLRQFRLLRERMIPKAQAQGIFTDQDVFDRVS